MKVAPVLRAMADPGRYAPILVHTGQHYDAALSDAFFQELDIPAPDVHLGVGSGSHARQTARVLEGFEPVVESHRPDLVLVAGDVNSTVACALASVKLGVPVGHIEAGLRSEDRTMPEEINRVLTDAISDLLFITSLDARTNLVREGVDPATIHFVGNSMIDTLRRFEDKARDRETLREHDLSPRGYALVTLHRPSNVDAAEDLGRVLFLLHELADRMPVAFPMHPR
ncbi:MAG: UDP-N-acetyl glucosamine 2-epimerase, partial [Candidatus Eisenbacteria bacterium]|nr:UDP-N-acetyl glucosamine 2-epimerase [Candidatus Eisenbacteria bacterium]